MSNPIPESFKQHHGIQFTDAFKTRYVIEAHESDISQLKLTKHGTTLDPTLEPTFEFQVFEVDNLGYKGLSGQYHTIDQVHHAYGVFDF